MSFERASRLGDIANIRKRLGLREDKPPEVILACSIPVAPQEANALRDGEKFKAAFGNAGNAMMIIDADYRVVAFNNASEKSTGWQASNRAALLKYLPLW